MSASREMNYPPDAPVLFRLPHIERFDSERQARAAATNSRVDADSSVSFAGYGTSAAPEPTSKIQIGTPERTSGPSTTSGREPALPAVGLDGPPSESRSSASWGLAVKQPVGMKGSIILVAILALMWGAWLLGRQSVSRTTGDLVAGQPSQPESPEKSAQVQAAEANAKADQRPKSSATQLATAQSVAANKPLPSKPLSISEPDDEAFYGDEDFDSATELNGPVSSSGSSNAIPVSSMGKPSANAVGSAQSGRFGGQVSGETRVLPGDDRFGPSSTAEFMGGNGSVSSPAALTAGTDRENVGWYHDVAPTDEAPNGNFLKSETPNSLGFDPVRAVQSVSKFSFPATPVLSPTPNGIIDWSRYLPQTGSVRSASAVGQMGRGGETFESNGQAFYSDDVGVPPADSAVAPFYR